MNITAARAPSVVTPKPPGHPHLCLYAVALAVVLTIVHVIVSAASGLTSLEPFGLINSMPATFVPTVAAWVIACVCLLRAEEERPALLGVTVVGITAVLHGTVAVLESAPRFPTAWLHSGYAQYILDEHDVLPELGARFSWPGFFALAASVIGPSSETVPEAVLRWSPLAFCLAYLPALLMIARSLVPGWRAPWLSLALFPLVNWVGQDYFAPQSFAFLISLVTIAVTLRWLTDRPRRTRRSSEAGGRDPGSPDPVTPDRGAQFAILVVCAVTAMGAALAVSHQLSPYVLCLQLVAIWAFRRGQALLVGLVVGLLALIWLSWGATTFWIPWFADVFGSLGHPTETVEATLGERTGSGNADHVRVVAVRMILAATVFAGACVGLGRLFWARRRIDLALPAAGLIPFALLLAQPYGGEGLLRAYLFASPFIAIALSCVFLPRGALSWTSALALVVAVPLASLAFLVARYGNESFERVTPDEVALAECMYETAPAGSTLIAVSPHLAWQFRDIADHEHVYRNGVVFDGRHVDDLLALADPVRDSFLIVTEPQLRFVERSLGAPPGWGDDLTSEIASDDRLTEVCGNSGGSVFRVSSPADGEEED